MGSPPQQSKSFRPQCDRLYLGASIHLGSFITDGFVRFQPKFLTRRKVMDKLSNGPLLKVVVPAMMRGSFGGIFNGCILCALVSWGGLLVPSFPNTKARTYLISSDDECRMFAVTSRICCNSLTP